MPCPQVPVLAIDSGSNEMCIRDSGCRALPYPKPDLVAPGVDIYAPRSGGGYASFTGTSFSTPFVTGAAALLMEWGITRRKDPYLYGEKLKAYLRRGAKALQGSEKLPNDLIGWGLSLIHISDWLWRTLQHRYFCFIYLWGSP